MVLGAFTGDPCRAAFAVAARRARAASARSWACAIVLAGLPAVLSGCGTTGTGMLGGALKGWQEHELRQRN